MSDRLFAYGTLRFADVLSALLDRVPEHRPASARGWRAAKLRGLNYPGLVPGDGEVTGVLITGLTPREWMILNAYEDDEYELVEIELTDGVTAWTYRYDRADLVLLDNWSADEFASLLPEFASSCRSWRMREGI